MVALWAALDGFADRAGLKQPTCTTCRMRRIPTRFTSYTQGNESQSLKELEDLRHLYAHNYAGEADGRRPWLDLLHLRMYSWTVQSLLERFP